MSVHDSNTELTQLRAQLAVLERASRPLDPGTTRRRALRNPVMASAERFLRQIENLPAFVDTDDKGAGLLGS